MSVVPASKEDNPISSMKFVWFGGGLASALAGLLLVGGHLFNLEGGPEYGTVLGGSSVLAAHLMLVFGLVVLYPAQAEHSGAFGALGMVLGVVGTTLVRTTLARGLAAFLYAKRPRERSSRGRMRYTSLYVIISSVTGPAPIFPLHGAGPFR